MNIVKFKLGRRANRTQALRWLAMNYNSFPKEIEGHIGPNIFHGWRFVVAIDGEVLFADCVHEGITEGELLQFIGLHANA